MKLNPVRDPDIVLVAVAAPRNKGPEKPNELAVVKYATHTKSYSTKFEYDLSRNQTINK